MVDRTHFVVSGEQSIKNEYFNTNQLRSDLKNQTVKGAGATVFARIVTYAIQMSGTIILARLLVPADFGLVAMVTIFSMILVEFGILRLTEATIQREQINHEQISTLFWINVGLCSILALFFILISPLIGWFYNEPRLAKVTIVLALSFIFSGLSVQHIALLQRNLLFHKFASIQIIAAICSTIIAITLAWFKWGYWALVAKYITLPIVTAIGAWTMCRWRPGLPSQGAGIRPMLKFGMNSLGNYSLNYVCRSLDKLLIGWQFGTHSLGFYDRAYHLFVLPANQLTFPLTNVAVATLSRLNNEQEKYQRYYLKAISTLAFIGMPLSAILTLIGRDFIILLLGSQWDHAGQIFSVFGPGIGIMLIYRTNGWLHLSLGRADRWFRWGIVELIITVIAFIIGLTKGPIGVAVAYSTTFYILLIPGLRYACEPSTIRISTILSAIWKYYIAALFTGLFIWFITHQIEATHQFFNQLDLVIRICLTIAGYIILYIMAVVFLFQSFDPLLSLVSLVKVMLPSGLKTASN